MRLTIKRKECENWITLTNVYKFVKKTKRPDKFVRIRSEYAQVQILAVIDCLSLIYQQNTDLYSF